MLVAEHLSSSRLFYVVAICVLSAPDISAAVTALASPLQEQQLLSLSSPSCWLFDCTASYFSLILVSSSSALSFVIKALRCQLWPPRLNACNSSVSHCVTSALVAFKAYLSLLQWYLALWHFKSVSCSLAHVRILSFEAENWKWKIRLLLLAMSQNKKCMEGDENDRSLTVGRGLC